MKSAIRKGRQLLLLGPLLLLNAACSGGVGDGETIQRIEITATNGVITAFQCFYSNLQAIAIFEEGGREDVTFRGTWSSSDPNAVAISNGDLKTPLGTTIGKGVIAPKAAPQTGAATISFSFVGLGASATVDIKPGRLELTPGLFRLAEGTGVNFVANGFLGDTAEEDFALLFSNNIVNWSVPDGAPAEVTNFDVNQGGGSVSTEDVASNTTVTVTAVTDMEGCNGVGQPGHASADITILNETFDRLEFRTLALGQSRANSNALITRMANGTDQLFRVLAVNTTDDTPGGAAEFVQDVTTRVISNQGTDAATDQGVFSSDTDVLLISGGTLRALPTSGTTQLTARLEQLGTTVETTAAVSVDVVETELTDIAVAPASQNGIPDTSVPFTATGTFNDGTVYSDLTPTALFVSSDNDIAVAAPGGSVAVDDEAADGASVTINAERVDNPSLDSAAQTTVSSDPGGSATLNVAAISAGTTLDIDFYPSAEQPRDTVCPNVGSDNSQVEDDLVQGSRCFLRARVTGSHGQDVTSLVVWESLNPSVATVGNAVPLVGELDVLTSAMTTVTVRARFFNAEGDLLAEGTRVITVNP